MSRDISVGIATSWTAGVQFPEGTGDFSLLHRDQNFSEAHPESCPTGTGGLKQPKFGADDYI
jgi:hypothetical protein